MGDCGNKTGFHEVDNGWIGFENYRVPKSALLNKLGDVTPEGEYVSHIKSNGKRFGMHIASLTGGRVLIMRNSIEQGFMSLKIAINYGLARKQFGNPTEKVIMDYPVHQMRLMPLLA